MSEAEEKAGAVLERLYEVIEGRRGADPEQSYVARLLDAGGSGIARKVGEESCCWFPRPAEYLPGGSVIFRLLVE